MDASKEIEMGYLKQYLCEFSDNRYVLEKLAEKYHEATESFDKTVCTGGIGIGGGVMPSNSYERGVINRHAKEVLDIISSEAISNGFSRRELMEEIRQYK